MADRSGEELDAVDSDEGVSERHEDSDEDLQEKDRCLGKACVFVVWLDEVEDEMSDSWEDYESLDDHDSSEVDTGDNGSQVRDDFYHSCKRNIESIWFVGIELTLDADEVTQTDEWPDETYNNNSDSYRVISEQRGIWVMDLSWWDIAIFQYSFITFHLWFVILLFLENVPFESFLINKSDPFYNQFCLFVLVFCD